MELSDISVPSVVNKVKKTAVYKEWKKENKKSYLISVFVSHNEKTDIAVNFYNPDTEKSATFNFFNEGEIHEDELFKKEEDEVRELKIESASVSVEKAVSIATHEASKKGAAQVGKTISILQNLEDQSLWNVTLISSDFNTVNIRINAEDEKIISMNISSLTDLMKQ